MARIRSVHPELFTDEGFCSLSSNARLLCIGIWTMCDDRGIFEWKPFGMKISLFPVDNVDINALLAELVDNQQVKAFETDGKTYGAVRNFCIYQRPKKPLYKHPFPDWCRTYVAFDRRTFEPAPPKPPTGGEKPPHRRGEERSRREEDNSKTDTSSKERVTPATADEPPAPPSETLSPVSSDAREEPTKATGSLIGKPLPADWTPNDQLCEEVKSAFGMTDADLQAELPAFHALNVSNGTISSNWNSTFYLFCKRWREHRDKQAAPRVSLSRAAAQPVKRPEEFTEADWDGIVSFYARSGRWSRGAGPDPMSPACVCPKAILEKHEINPATGERRIPPRKVPA